MSSEIQNKLATFDELIELISDLQKLMERSEQELNSTLSNLKSSGNWDDAHFDNFKGTCFSYYSMSIASGRQTLEMSKDFLLNKRYTLEAHKNS